MKKTCYFLFIAGLACCGVKGKPLPPLEPPMIGRGEPSFLDASSEINLKKTKPKKIKDDWNEPKDFSESSEKNSDKGSDK